MGSGSGPGGGIVLAERGVTSKRRLQVEWTYPVYTPPAPRTEREHGTTARAVEAALPRAEAFRFVAAGDPRPLLVVRECDSCAGTDDALLSRRIGNEKTVLMSRWFRCVKLPIQVLDEQHAFRALFDSEHPPHLFLARADGSNVVPMSGSQSQSELWSAMTDLLKEVYQRDPNQATKQWLELLTRYDTLDGLEATLRERRDKELEKNGPRSPKLARIERDLERVVKQRAEVEEKERAVQDLGLRPTDVGAGDATPAAR